MWGYWFPLPTPSKVTSALILVLKHVFCKMKCFLCARSARDVSGQETARTLHTQCCSRPEVRRSTARCVARLQRYRGIMQGGHPRWCSVEINRSGAEEKRRDRGGEGKEKRGHPTTPSPGGILKALSFAACERALRISLSSMSNMVPSRNHG